MFLEGIFEQDGENVREQVIYWRKSNQVHNWFVVNAQDGEERDLCRTVLADNDKAEELLPTRPGFFFGAIDYDEWYYYDLQYTVEKIDEVLKDDRYLYFEYCSWW